MAAAARPRRGRPTREQAAELDQRLRTAALDEFLAHGFDGTTMEAVAAAAGITKRTLYARYENKRTLFSAIVPWALAHMPAAPEPLELPDELEPALRLIGGSILGRVLEPRAVQLRRLAAREAHRFPEFAEPTYAALYYDNVRVLFDVLGAHAEAGTIVVDDLALTVDHFLELVAGLAVILADYGVPLDPEDEARRLDHAVRFFLAAVTPG